MRVLAWHIEQETPTYPEFQQLTYGLRAMAALEHIILAIEFHPLYNFRCWRKMKSRLRHQSPTLPAKSRALTFDPGSKQKPNAQQNQMHMERGFDLTLSRRLRNGFKRRHDLSVI